MTGILKIIASWPRAMCLSVGETVITTKSGRYEPIIIDFTQRDGRRRLAEIREAIQAGTFDKWLELVFLPLYGKETGIERSLMVEDMLRFETELYHADKIPVRLLVAALILSNKFIDKNRLKALWEDIKMLDIFEIAREEGIREGKTLGIMEAMHEMIMKALIERFNMVTSSISEQVRRIQNPDILKGLHRQAVICKDLQEFEAVLKQVR